MHISFFLYVYDKEQSVSNFLFKNVGLEKVKIRIKHIGQKDKTTHICKQELDHDLSFSFLS